MYDVGIPFNAVNYDSFAPMIHAIGRYGKYMKPPTYHEVRVTYLDKEEELTKEKMKDNIAEKEKYGCSLMADGWKDRKGRALINFLMNTPKGSMYVDSVDASSYSHTGEKMFEFPDEFVGNIGPEHIVQVVTDSASSNVAAGKLLEEKYPHFYWTPCVAHCLDLMFEDIFKLPSLKKVYEQGVAFNGFIYNRAFLLNMLRTFTKKAEMVRTAKTRFATAFLTLQRFLVQKANLKRMFTSQEWYDTKISREPLGRRMENLITSTTFWNRVKYAVKVAGPLIHVLRLVDGEKRPAMGYIYEAMDRAKEKIEDSFNYKKEKYSDIFQIIDRRWDIQPHRPLHAAGHFLNPKFFYSNPDILQNEEVMKGLHFTIQRLVPDIKVQDLISSEIDIYTKGERNFGISLAIRHRTCETKSPAEWWQSYGSSTPNLQKFAVKILNLVVLSDVKETGAFSSIFIPKEETDWNIND